MLNPTPRACLTVQRPWAGAILVAGKDVENRVWETSYRGELLIHAGRVLASGARCPRGHELRTHLDEYAGQVIGVVDLYDVVEAESCQLMWASAVAGRKSYCWLLRNPRVFVEPVPMRGRVGVYQVQDARIESQLQTALAPDDWHHCQREEYHRQRLAEDPDYRPGGPASADGWIGD